MSGRFVRSSKYRKGLPVLARRLKDLCAAVRARLWEVN